MASKQHITMKMKIVIEHYSFFFCYLEFQFLILVEKQSDDGEQYDSSLLDTSNSTKLV